MNNGGIPWNKLLIIINSSKRCYICWTYTHMSVTVVWFHCVCYCPGFLRSKYGHCTAILSNQM